MTVLTLFDSDRARGAVRSDAVRVACRTCAALHARRRLHGAQRPWGGEKAPDGVHGSRCEETIFTPSAMNRARLADSRGGLAVRGQRVLLCTRRALHAARSAARAA